MRRRHPDVDDRNIRPQPFDEREQLIGVGREPVDLERGLPKQAHQPLAEDDRVIGEDYAHGISTRTTDLPSLST